MRIVVIGLSALLLAGCAAGSGGVRLQNPRTGAEATCPSSWHDLDPWAQTEACVGRYEAAGWVRVEAR